MSLAFMGWVFALAADASLQTRRRRDMSPVNAAGEMLKAFGRSREHGSAVAPAGAGWDIMSAYDKQQERFKMSKFSTPEDSASMEPPLGSAQGQQQSRKSKARWARARALAWQATQMVALGWVIGSAVSGMMSAGKDFLQKKDGENNKLLAPREDQRAAVEEMKAEQAWLVKEKLGVGRPIEFATYETDGHMSTRRAGDGALGFAIVAGSRGWDKASAWSMAAQPRYVYRHEEGHAEMSQMAVRAQRSASMAGGWGEVVSNMTNRAAIVGRLVDAGAGAPWRSKLLTTLRSEAFADAYACLSIARRGQESLRECAMMAHAMRMFPAAALENGMTSLSAKGSDHSVDMASFMSGQLRAADVGALDKGGLLELAARIADESVAWSVARNATESGASSFFNDDGREWWVELGREGGLSRKEAGELFDGWRKEASAGYPSAAFGSATWIIQGRTFTVEKLPRSARSARWRFEGFGGMIVTAAWSDPRWSRASSERPVDASGSGSGSYYSVPAADGRSVCAQAPEKCWDGRSDGYKEMVDSAREGALDTHFALAKKLGASAAEEADRLKELVGGERFLVAAIDRRMARENRVEKRSPIGQSGLRQ